MPDDKLPIPQFAAKIKAKYPAYKDIEDTVLTQKIIEKYPEYKDMVDLSGLSVTPSGTLKGNLDKAGKQKVLDYMQGLKTPQDLSDIQLAKPITQSKTTKKNENPFTETKEQAIAGATSKLNDIIYGDNEDWKDPIKAAAKGTVNSKTAAEAADYLGAKTLTEQSLMPDGVEAKKTLAETILGQMGEDNLTAKMLRDKAQQYDKTVAPLRTIKTDEDLSRATEEFLKVNYTGQLNNAAIKYYADKHPEFKKELAASGIDINDPVVADRIPSGKRGIIKNEFFNDPDINTYLQKENPNLIPAFQVVEKYALTDDKDYGINVVANKVSRAVQQSGFNNIDPIFNFYDKTHKEMANTVAKEVLTPQELQIWDAHIKDNQEDYMDTPSFFEGFASAGKDFGKGLANTFTQVGIPNEFHPISETIKENWEKEASNVSADPKGLLKYARDAGQAFGLVSSILATGNITGIANPKTAGMVATSLGFFGDQLEQGKIKYPDSPIKAWTSAAVNTSLYAALSYDIFPGGKAKAAFDKVKPEVSKVVESLTSGAITKEAARKELNTLGKQAVDFAGGTLKGGAKISAELTGITAFNRGLDKIMGLDEEEFKKFHPDDEIAQTLSSTFVNFLPIAGLGKFGEMKQQNKIVEESLYKAATNPKYFERVIDELQVKDPSIKKEDLLKNLKFLTETKSLLDDYNIRIPKQKKYLFNALNEEVLHKQKEDLINKKASIPNEVLRDKKQTEIDSVDGQIKESKNQQQDILNEKKPTIESAVIEINGKTYEGKNHAEAILKAQQDGQDISKVDRQAEGKFRLSDGTIIDREQAKEQFGQDRSELLIEQDEASKLADQAYADQQKPVFQSDEKILADIKENKTVSDIEKGADLEFFVSKAGEDPVAFEERFGAKMTKQLLDKIPTEKLQENRDFLAKINEDQPSVKYLDDVILERGKIKEPTTIEEPVLENEKVSDVVGNDFESKKADIERRRKTAWAADEGNTPGTFYGWYETGKPDPYGGIDREMITGKSEKEVLEKINAKYDAELAELEKSKPSDVVGKGDGKAGIEKRRQAELDEFYPNGKWRTPDFDTFLKRYNLNENTSQKEIEKIINDKYDSELVQLEKQKPPTQSQEQVVNKENKIPEVADFKEGFKFLDYDNKGRLGGSEEWQVVKATHEDGTAYVIAKSLKTGEEKTFGNIKDRLSIIQQQHRIANEQKPSTPSQEQASNTSNVESFETAKEGDVVFHNGDKVTVVGKTKTRGGRDVVEVKKENATGEEIRARAINDISARKGIPLVDVEKYHAGELSNLISEYTKTENSKTSTYTIDKEQWDKEVKGIEQPTPKGNTSNVGGEGVDLAGKENGVTSPRYGKATENISGKEAKSASNTSQPQVEESPEKLNERYKRVTDGNDFIDPYDRAVKYFADGGKINPSELERIFGGKGDKGASISLIKNDGGTIKQIAHHLWETDPSGKYEDTHYIDAVESALRENNSKSAMQKDIADRYDYEAQREKYYQQRYGKEAADIVDNLSEEEINHILQLESDATKQKELEDYLDNIKSPESVPSKEKVIEESVEPTDDKGVIPPEPPKDNIVGLSPEQQWTGVRQEKLAEIEGAKEILNKSGTVSWDETNKNALENLQARFPDKSLYDAARARMQELTTLANNKVPYSATSEDVAVMQYFNLETQKRINEIQGWDSPDEMQRIIALAQWERLNEDLMMLPTVSKGAISEAARALYKVQEERRLDPEYGLQIRRMELLNAKDGEKLTDEDLKWTADQWEKEREILIQEHEVREKGMQESFDKKIADLTKEYEDKLAKAQKGKKPKTIAEKRENMLSQKGKDFADKLREGKLKGGTYGTIPGFPQAVNLVIEAIAQIVEKGATLAEAIQQYVAKHKIEDPEKFKDNFFDVLDVREKGNAAFEAIKKDAEQNKVRGITNDMVGKNHIRDFVQSYVGSVESNKVLEAAHKELQKVLPDVTKEELREAYLKEGVFRQPTKEKLESDIKKDVSRLTKLEKIEKDLSDLKEQQKIVSRGRDKRLPQKIDKAIETAEKRLKDEMIEQGVKFSHADKFQKASYDTRAAAHNQRVDEMSAKIQEHLDRPDLTDAQKNRLTKLKSQLDAAKILLDPESKLDQSKLFDKALNLVKAAKSEFERGMKIEDRRSLKEVNSRLQGLIDKYSKDKEESEQDVKLQRQKNSIKTQNDERHRKLNAGEYQHEPSPSQLKKTDAELIKLQIERNKLESENQKKLKQEGDKRKSKLEKITNVARAGYVMLLIGKLGTLGKVAATSIYRPNIEAATRATFGQIAKTLLPDIYKAAKRGGESTSWRTIKGIYSAYIKQLGEKKLEAMYDKLNDKYEQASKKYLEQEQLVKSLDKNSKEYKNAEQKLNELKTQRQSALLDSVSGFMYKFMGGSSIADAWSAFWERSNKIEQEFGYLSTEGYGSDVKGIKSLVKSLGKSQSWEYVFNTMGRLHSAVKTFSARSNFAAGFIARLEAMAADGEDITKPEAVMFAANESYIDWEHGKYQQDNLITSGFNAIVKSVEKLDKGGELEKYSKAVSNLMRWDIAITKVPVNILHEAIAEYMMGLPRALYEAKKAYSQAAKGAKQEGFTKGTTNVGDVTYGTTEKEFKQAVKDQLSQMDKKQAALIFRCFRKGGFGLGLMAFTMLSGLVGFGGFHHRGEKKKKPSELGEKELNPGELMFGDTRAGKFWSNTLGHLPVTFGSQMGLNTVKIYEDKVNRGEMTYEAAIDAAMSDLETIQDDIPQTKLFAPITRGKEIFKSGVRSAEGISSEMRGLFGADDVDENGDPIVRKPLNTADELNMLFGNKKKVLTVETARKVTAIENNYAKIIESLTKEGASKNEIEQIKKDRDAAIEQIKQEQKNNQ